MSIANKVDAQRCRSLAVLEREQAEAEPLPRQREQHLASAFHWDRLADISERAAPGRGAALATIPS